MPPDQLPTSSPHHPLHFPGPTNSKTTAIHKTVNSDGTPVTLPAVMYTGVVADKPRSLSPTSASPEGQVMWNLYHYIIYFDLTNIPQLFLQLVKNLTFLNPSILLRNY